MRDETDIRWDLFRPFVSVSKLLFLIGGDRVAVSE
jgi:hypothetical protein